MKKVSLGKKGRGRGKSTFNRENGHLRCLKLAELLPKLVLVCILVGPSGLTNIKNPEVFYFAKTAKRSA